MGTCEADVPDFSEGAGHDRKRGRATTKRLDNMCIMMQQDIGRNFEMTYLILAPTVEKWVTTREIVGPSEAEEEELQEEAK